MIITIDGSQRAFQNMSLRSGDITGEEAEAQLHDMIYQDATSAHCLSGKWNWIHSWPLIQEVLRSKCGMLHTAFVKICQ